MVFANLRFLRGDAFGISVSNLCKCAIFVQEGNLKLCLSVELVFSIMPLATVPNEVGNGILASFAISLM